MALLTLTNPQIIQFISAFPDDLSPFRSFRPLSFQGPPVVPKLLDALVFFLHTTPGGKHALTIELSAHEIFVTLAASISTDAATASERSSPLSSPQATLEKIWEHMVSCCSVPPNAAANTKLALCLLEIHFPLLVYRFEKRRELYLQLREATRRSEVAVNLGYRVTKFLDAADVVYTAIDAFCSGSFNRGSALKFMEILPHCVSQFRSKQPTSIGLRELAGARSQANIEDDTFNIVNYIQKLTYPLIHINSIFGFCFDKTGRDYTARKLRVKLLATPTIAEGDSTLPQACFDCGAVASFIGAICGPDCSSTEVVVNLAQAIVQNLHKSKPHIISTLHPECVLIAHYHNNRHLVPLSYIATSRPPCFQCAAFIHVYNLHARTTGHLPFSTQECDDRVRPCSLPTIEGADAIQTSMSALFRLMIADVVRKRVSCFSCEGHVQAGF